MHWTFRIGTAVCPLQILNLLPSKKRRISWKCALFIKNYLFLWKTPFCILIKTSNLKMSFYKKCQTRCASWRNDNNLDNQFSMNILTTDLELEILRESSKSYWPFLPSNLATNQEIGRAQSVFSIYLQDSRPKTKQVKFIPGQINFHKSQRIGWRSCHGIKRQHSSPVLKMFLITLQLYQIF